MMKFNTRSPLPKLSNLSRSMVEEEPSQKQEEKTEILGVLAGLRKYAPDHVLLVGQLILGN
jgi:predicted NACHT family NTPase